MSTVITDDEVRSHVAANVQRILADRRLSQRDLAERSGESIMNINRVCRAENVVRIGIVARIAEALDVSIDRLVAVPPLENSRQTA